MTIAWRQVSLAALLGLFLLFGAAWMSVVAANDETFGPQKDLLRQAIVFERAAGAGPVRFEVEVASTYDQVMIGMMFRPHVPRGTGMLFVFDPPKPASFWMKNTLVPLDMIFIGNDGIITNIGSYAKPHDLTPVSSTGPVAYVLEIGGGEAKRLGLRAGDRLTERSRL